MAPSVSDFARASLPETYDALLASEPGLPGLQVDRAIGDLFVAGTTEVDLTDRAKAYVGDVVARALIPPGIDYWMNQARLADSVNQESVSYYNRVAGLRQLDAMIASRIASNKGLLETEVPDLVPGSRRSAVPKVSSQGKRKLTQDPEDMESLNPVRRPGTWT